MYIYASQSKNTGKKSLVLIILLIISIIVYNKIPESVATGLYGLENYYTTHNLHYIKVLCIGAIVCILILGFFLFLPIPENFVKSSIPYIQLRKDGFSAMPLNLHPIWVEYDKVKSFNLNTKVTLKLGFPLIRRMLEVHWKEEGKESNFFEVTRVKNVSASKLLEMLQFSLNDRVYSAMLEESATEPTIKVEPIEVVLVERSHKSYLYIAILMYLVLIGGPCWLICSVVPELMSASTILSKINILNLPATIWCILLLVPVFVLPLSKIIEILKLYLVHPVSIEKDYIRYSGFKLEYDDVQKAEAVCERFCLDNTNADMIINSLHLITKKDGKHMTDVDIYGITNVHKSADIINEILQQRKVSPKPEG